VCVLAAETGGCSINHWSV